jgi:hypothetical protein
MPKPGQHLLVSGNTKPENEMRVKLTTLNNKRMLELKTQQTKIRVELSAPASK